MSNVSEIVQAARAVEKLQKARVKVVAALNALDNDIEDAKGKLRDLVGAQEG